MKRTADGWKLTPPFTGAPYKYNVGDALSGCALNSKPSNASGGVGFDSDPGATYGFYATGDALQFFGSPVIYGFMGFNTSTGGTSATSPLIVLYGHGWNFKRKIGDIEISCPPGENPY